MRVFLLGAGYSAQVYARRIAGAADAIVGTTRSEVKGEALREAGIAPLIFDGTSISTEMAKALATTTHFVMSAAPAVAPRDGDSRDPLLRFLPNDLRANMPALRWVGYLSTVGVYGNHDGAWVSEDSDLRPVSPRAVARVAAERDWLAAGEVAGIQVAVLRLAGIYGPGRNALVNLIEGKARRTVKPGQVFNRIHVDDIAGALEFLGDRQIGGIFNVADDEPGPPQDVVTCAASLMGVEPPSEVPFDQVEMTAMARSFWRDNKRVSNARLKAAGYAVRFPNHRLALDTMWREETWRDAGGNSRTGH